MTMPVQPRLEFDPLLKVSGCATVAELEQRLTAGRQAIGRWKNHGGIPLFSADRAAADLGLHPLNVWGDAWPVDA